LLGISRSHFSRGRACLGLPGRALARHAACVRGCRTAASPLAVVTESERCSLPRRSVAHRDPPRRARGSPRSVHQRSVFRPLGGPRCSKAPRRLGPRKCDNSLQAARDFLPARANRAWHSRFRLHTDSHRPVRSALRIAFASEERPCVLVASS
jgi:hypothetical protein